MARANVLECLAELGKPREALSEADPLVAKPGLGGGSFVTLGRQPRAITARLVGGKAPRADLFPPLVRWGRGSPWFRAHAPGCRQRRAKREWGACCRGIRSLLGRTSPVWSRLGTPGSLRGGSLGNGWPARHQSCGHPGRHAGNGWATVGSASAGERRFPIVRSPGSMGWPRQAQASDREYDVASGALDNLSAAEIGTSRLFLLDRGAFRVACSRGIVMAGQVQRLDQADR